MNQPETDPKLRTQVYDQFLRCVDREENLIHYRITWGMQWNIAAFVAVFAYYGENGIPSFLSLCAAIVIVLAAFASSVMTYFGVQAAHGQISFLIDSLNRRLGLESQTAWESSEFLRPYGEPSQMHKPARRVSFFLPLVFAVIWGLMFLYLVSIAHTVF